MPGSSRCKVSAALSAHRALGGGILMLFKAAVWTFHTDFNRRRLCHGLAKKVNLCPCPERCRLYRLFVPNHVRTRMGCLGRLGIAPNGAATGDFRFPDERRPFLNNETRRFQITLQSAARLKLAAFAHSDVALNLSVNRDRLGFDLATDVRVFPNGQDPIGINLTLHLSV